MFSLRLIKWIKINFVIKLFSHAQGTLPSKQIFLNDKKDLNKRSSTVAKPSMSTTTDEPLKFYLGSGNNSALVKRVLSIRGQWTETTDSK